MVKEPQESQKGKIVTPLPPDMVHTVRGIVTPKPPLQIEREQNKRLKNLSLPMELQDDDSEY